MAILAARRATDVQRSEMLDLADKLENAINDDDRGHYLEINKSIHILEAKATGNRFLQSQLNYIHNLSRRFWYSFISDTQTFSRGAAHHAETLGAMAARDEDMAVHHNNALIDLLESVTRDAIGQR